MLPARGLKGTAQMLYGTPRLFWSVLLMREVSCCCSPLSGAWVSLGLCKGMKAVHSCSRLAAERRGGASHAVGFVPHG